MFGPRIQEGSSSCSESLLSLLSGILIRLHSVGSLWHQQPTYQGTPLFEQEQFLLQPCRHPQERVLLISTGQADLRDEIGTRWPSFIDQPNSVQCGVADLEMWAFLSIMVARATLLTCTLKASSVGSRTFRSVDLLFRNLYTLSIARSEPSKWSALDW